MVMFDILKKKLSDAVDSISGKAGKDEAVDESGVKKDVSSGKGESIKGKFDKVVKKITHKELRKSDLTPILDELEIGLIEADVALDVARKIKGDILEELSGRNIRRGDEREFIIDSFRKSLLGILSVDSVDLLEMGKNKSPTTLLFMGFNGVGKTTSIAKTADWILKNDMSCVLAAADTFRAASIEQLGEHADNLGVKMIKHDYGSDPAAVVYDAIEHAKSKNIDFVLADSAGRMHTNKNLMRELEKIDRVNNPDIKILVIDSLTGNDAILQADAFDKVGVDAVIFTKVDVNEKGGAILSVTHRLQEPVLFLGVGEDYDDFIRFDAEEFVDNLLK